MTVITTREKTKTYIVSVIIPLALGAIVGLLTSGSMSYDDLIKPDRKSVV